ncbi:MAG TPA: aldo/keto reductase [Bryobacterales bacterium]|nr:aldo/keto reductase [Bryobacterales bacterium]
MEYRLLPGTDLKVSRVCMGTMTFGSQADEVVSRSIVDRCLDAGINFFDTANSYNKGRSEEILGGIVKGRRGRFVVASKVFNKMGDGPDESGLSKAAIHKQVDASLSRLQTDYLDIYYLHQPDQRVPLEETMEAMNYLVKQGKVRHLATSNYSAWQICRILWLCEKNGWRAPLISQPMYNLLARGIEQEYLPFTRQFGVANIVYNPLAGGLLTGKQRPESGPVAGTRFDKNQMYLDRYWHDDNFRAVEDLAKAAAKAGRTLVELSLVWVMQQPGVDGVLLGASRLEQLEENLRAVEGKPLDPPVLEACDAVWARLRGVTPKYNR